MLKYAHVCNKCNANTVASIPDMPDGWVRLEFFLTRTKTKEIVLHLCPTCRQAVNIPDETIDPEQTQEQKLLQLIKDIATS